MLKLHNVFAGSTGEQGRTKVKKVLSAVALAALLAALAVFYGPSIRAQLAGGPSSQSYAAGVYYSPNYSWRGFTETSVAAGAGQTVILGPDLITLPDGRQVHQFGAADNQLLPVAFDIGANNETVTPTAVSVVSCPTAGDFAPPAQCVSFTGTFSNAHGLHTFIGSSSQGISEAINDAGSNGGGLVFWQIDPGIVTLSTSGANTNAGSINIPTRSVVMSATARVTTTIGTCAGGWSLGFTSGTEFSAANTTLTAGTTTDSSTLTLPAIMSGAATPPIIHCTTSNASAGAVHPKFAGYKLAAPLS